MRRIVNLVFVFVVVVSLLLCPALALDDVPPSNPPFYGSGYVSGSSSQLGYITLYFPISYKDGYLGVDSNGYLYNVSNSSITCYLPGYENVSIPAWSYPRYRRQAGNSWDYQDIYLSPSYSNCDVATAMEPVVTLPDLLPYVSILLLGVLFVCFIRRS